MIVKHCPCVTRNPNLDPAINFALNVEFAGREGFTDVPDRRVPITAQTASRRA